MNKINSQLSAIVKYYPIQIGLSITDRCNLHCKMCEREYYLKKNILDTTNDISLSSIKQIIKKIKGKVEFVNISAGYGEPLLHKDIVQIIQELKNNNLKVILFTNATLLTKELSKKIAATGLDLILFSFEGYTKKEYENLRVGANYKRVFENIQYFIKFKKAIKSPTKTTLTATVTKERYFQKINSLLELTKILSVDKLEIHDTFFCKSYNKQQPQRITTINDKKGVLRDFKILQEKAISYDLELILPKIKIKNGVIFCPDPWRSLYFRKDGYVRPCCIDYEKVWNKNIFHNTLEEIWNCNEMINWRKKFIENKPPKICQNCPIGEVSENEDIKDIFNLI